SEDAFYYKMEGVDLDWVFSNRQKELSYPNLSPGTYVLHVTTANEQGVLNPNEKLLTIVISPPWWKSWWAYFLYIMVFVGILWQFIHFQVKRVRLQNELLYKEKETLHLQQIDEVKNRFFTNITHEFRTPLTLIIEPVRQLLKDKSLVTGHPSLRIIFNNANRLLALVNQLLDLSKLQEGKMQIHWSKGDVLPLFQEVSELFLPVIEKKQQQLLWECELNQLITIADHTILEKIAYNLLSNAHKFTPEGGEITLRITQPTAQYWQIEVEDTGVGIEEKKLPHIFQRFYQADNSLTRNNEGTGIGLALVKELCDLLGAEITVKSIVNQGTTVKIVFSLRPIIFNSVLQSHSNREVTTLPEIITTKNSNLVSLIQAETQQETILLVEDNPDMREYLQMTLEQQGYQVMTAENGKLGVQTALEFVPDIIISDVMMPEMNGYELTETLKQHSLTSHIPIVLLTAKGRIENKIEGYKRGADAYLPKPFQTEELLVRLQQLLAMRQKLQQKYQASFLPAQEKAIQVAVEMEQENVLASENELPSLSKEDSLWLENLRNIIQQELHKDSFIADELPPLVFMSRTQFYGKVKALIGLTPARLVREIRLQTAYQLIVSQPKLHLKDVILQIGLNDVKHFSTLFKEQFGISPQELQRDQLKKNE
ncbi:MAG: response regulator, partial [Bacteroidia bacterium]